MKHRVVVTGMGIVAPNGVGLAAFDKALRAGTSGVRHFPELQALNFSCQVGGKPELKEELLERYFKPVQLKNLNSSGIAYGVVAGMEALQHSGIEPAQDVETPYWDMGVLFGTGTSGVEKFREAVQLLDQGKVRRLGSSTVGQIMASGISAYLGGMIGAGNRVSTNSSACATGTEAILLGYQQIASGKARKMLCGSCSDHGPYVWGGFDAMRVTSWKYNDQPRHASRPMSKSASGMVPASGAGALLLESLESAKERGAPIIAELLGGMVNSGGQRMGGSMTAPNGEAVRRCIKGALEDAGVKPEQLDTINGHLTATSRDPEEIENWVAALGLEKGQFPAINSLKGLTGHGLAASGSMEAVATLLQLQGGYIFGNANSEDLHPRIEASIGREAVPQATLERSLQTVISASFGFGDVNACVIFRKNS